MTYVRDQLGFLPEVRCPVCGVAMYLSEEDEARGRAPICLNACALSPASRARMAADLSAIYRQNNHPLAAQGDGAAAEEDGHGAG